MPSLTPHINYLTKLFQDVAQKGFFHLFSANLLIALLGFCSQLLVVKLLTPIDIGNIKVLQSFFIVASMFAGFGFNTAVLKLCSENRPAKEKAYILKKASFYSVVPIIIVIIAIVLMAHYRLLSPAQEINHWLIVYMMILPSSVFASLLMVYLQALRKIILMARIQVILRIIGVILLVSATYLFGFSGYIYSTIIVNILSLISLVYLVKNDFHGAIKVDRIFVITYNYAKWSFAANMVNTLVNYMDIFMLNFLIDDRVGFGYYSIATIFILALSQITSTVQGISTPYFSNKSHDKETFMKALKKYHKIMVLGSLIISMTALITVPVFIKLVYGSNYAMAGNIFMILCFKHFIVSCYAIHGVAILGLGKMKHNFYTSVIAGCVAIPISYLFIKWMGITGAAVAQVISCLLILLIMSFMIRHVINIHFDEKDHFLPQSERS